ncbi:hypothetical protein [Pseudomonas sp. BE134]|uniref:helix-turn-helix transcriptional regulator n=1 Tax=Pseudomonas sp. BE134 TaxID=2817843 RepID=UPI0028615F1B|nr:hypothetical protein [Pseudomonas sp. BE134]MDR6924371.1 addiction module HigA family antidote [Pseudomonas sp. BE134]
MTVTALAEHLGYSKVQLSNVIYCRTATSADLAWCLELAGLDKTHMWLGWQSAYDLWLAQHKTETE